MKYREESGRFSFYETSYSTTLEIEDILGELDGAAFKDSLEGLWTAMQELAKAPSDSTYMSMLVSKASSFVQNATSVYRSFIEYQNNLNLQVKDMVDEINAIGSRIDELNKKIAVIETGGIEKANDLRDERDLLIDTLAGYGNITYSEDLTAVLRYVLTEMTSLLPPAHTRWSCCRIMRQASIPRTGNRMPLSPRMRMVMK